MIQCGLMVIVLVQNVKRKKEMKFILGKKYVSSMFPNSPMQCIGFTLKGYPVLDGNNDYLSYPNKNQQKYWQEHQEPVVHKRWVHCLKNKYSGEIITSTVKTFTTPPYEIYEIIKTEEITYTEE